MDIGTLHVVATSEPVVELERLGEEIAELAVHLDAATARLLDLIREFDARGGWGNGFRSCAHWLSWRVGLAPGAKTACPSWMGERLDVGWAIAVLHPLANNPG